MGSPGEIEQHAGVREILNIEGGFLRWIPQVDSPGEIEQQVCGKFCKFQELMSLAAGSGEVGAENSVTELKTGNRLWCIVICKPGGRLDQHIFEQ